MSNRRELLADLIALRRPLATILPELERTRVATESLAVLTRRDLAAVLRRVRAGELGLSDAVAWAKEIELIDDVDRESGWEATINSILFELATPEVDDRSSQRKMKEWRSRLLSLSLPGRPRSAPPRAESLSFAVNALDLARREWIEVGHWESDLCATAIARADDPRRLVYISTWNLPPGRYYFECEEPTGPNAEDYSVVDAGEDVDFGALLAALERHLGASGRRPDA